MDGRISMVDSWLSWFFLFPFNNLVSEPKYAPLIYPDETQ